MHVSRDFGSEYTIKFTEDKVTNKGRMIINAYTKELKKETSSIVHQMFKTIRKFIIVKYTNVHKKEKHGVIIEEEINNKIRHT